MERSALVVEDDAFVAAALAEALSQAGYMVQTASNGFSAVRLAIDSRPSVVLLDLLLPEKSGGDVLAELRAEASTHDVAVVVVSGNTHLLTPDQLAEVDGVIGKPFDLAELVDTVSRAVQRAEHRQSEIAPVAATAHRMLAGRVGRAAGLRRPRPPLSS